MAQCYECRHLPSGGSLCAWWGLPTRRSIHLSVGTNNSGHAEFVAGRSARLKGDLDEELKGIGKGHGKGSMGWSCCSGVDTALVESRLCSDSVMHAKMRHAATR
eukprot:3194128-Rhodomonas_salina.1